MSGGFRDTEEKLFTVIPIGFPKLSTAVTIVMPVENIPMFF